MAFRRAICAAWCASAWLLVQTASAQDAAGAAALFDLGVKEMEAGRYDAACPPLAESYRLEPKPGALFTLAECEAKAGLVATAVAHYDDYLRTYQAMTPAQQATQRGRDKTAQKQKQALAPLVPQLTLVLPANAPAGVTVTRDGVALREPSLGVALPVDPGEHVVVTKTATGETNEQRITIAKGESKRVELVIASSGAPQPAAEVTAPPPEMPAQDTPAPSESSGARTAAFVVGGIGIAALGVGLVTGGLALSKKSTITDNCEDMVCNAEGKTAADDGQSLALVSTIGFAVGGAALGTAVVLFIVSSSSQTKSAAAASSKSEKPAARLAPMVASDGRGLWLGVRRAW